jgi:thiol:disulfide interchange protein
MNCIKQNCFRIAVVALVAFLVLPTACLAQDKKDQTETAQNKKVGENDTKAKVEKPARAPIYDESADAALQIEQALAKAKKENRRVLIQWGGNWCGWCHLLHDMFKKNGNVRQELMYEYDVVLVDIGRQDKNQELLKKYEVDLKSHGVPFLTVLDSAGAVVTNQETSSLESKEKDAKEHDEEAVMEFLKKHRATPVDAEAALASAMETGRRESKLVFLHFGAPWCGWCHHLEKWIAEPEVNGILSDEFVDLKIDNDRMKNAEVVYDKYCKVKSGIPWFVFLDPVTGQEVVNSDAPQGGNVGFPSTDEEIGHFCQMLSKCGDRFDAEKIEWFRKSLVANREKREAARPKK